MEAWVPVETNSEKISKLQRESWTSLERIDQLSRELLRSEKSYEESRLLVRDLDKRTALLAEKIDWLEQNIIEIRSKRWDLWKIALAAALGSLLTLVVAYLNRTLDRRADVESAGRPPATSERK
jgi:hypothetical protein